MPQTTNFQLKIEQVMTPQELRDSGVSNLTTTQRQALNLWLNRYTDNILKLALHSRDESPSIGTVQTSCSPAIESTISGESEGWNGETIFKLDNGQIWQQAEYAYTYFYAYRPDVTIYNTREGCRMKVEDEEETILVRRLK